MGGEIMIHNFRTEIEKVECDLIVKECLLQLYKAEERGLRDSRYIPSATYYENTINSCYNEFDSSQEKTEEESK
jgi:hypothetical protein